ncbi:unnamed protein product [Ilex paraguariensis]|uniref:AT-rich interactive domain-containing protein 2 n=1 Tax=Ilex paraguariensis TaxID=185542 RepID=A0ABC8UYL9_9AQUA
MFFVECILHFVHIAGDMGSKRHFDEEEFLEFSFKHPKQHDCGDKVASFAGAAEGIFCKSQFSKEPKNDSVNAFSNSIDKEVDSSAPLSWGSSPTNEEDTGSGAAFCPSFSRQYFEFEFPTFIQFEDSFSSMLHSSPRKEVPVGPDHQADVPAWEPEVIKKHPMGCGDIVDIDKEEQLMGAYVITMPGLNSSAHDGVKAGNGRHHCSCPDEGSIRCVQQHCKEFREKLRETIGLEKFVNLGFSDMGEEVAHSWTKEEEDVFHEVVYLNPASLGKNFWWYFPLKFPSRTKKELVSYYFNVFLLRRRAVQNRSNLLEIDSDDDEWQGSDVGGLFAVEPFFDQDGWVEHSDQSPDETGNDDDDNGDGNAEEIAGVADTTEGDIEVQIEKSTAHKSFSSSDGFGSGYASDPCDAKVWDAKSSTGPMKGVDLLPACNMIEEICGPCTWDSKSSKDKH